MFQETEIKLRIDPETANSIRTHPILAARQAEGWRSGVIYNQYYDTPDKRLASAGVALRMRRDGDQYIQTLKYNADSIAGMSTRKEWDWYLDSPDLDLSVLDSHCWPADLKDVDTRQLAPIFRTDFKRTRALIRWQRNMEIVEVEAAIDEGSIETAESSDSICELELELRKGPDIAVLELAHSLAESTALMPCDLSKSERGYKLLVQAEPNYERAFLQWADTVKVRTAMRDIGQALLADLVSLSEHFYTSHDWTSFCRLHRKLGILHQYFQVFRGNIPKLVREELIEYADAFFNDHQMDAFVSLNEINRDDYAESVFNSWIRSHRWGRLLIGFGKWLHTELSGSDQSIGATGKTSDYVLISWLKNEIVRTMDILQKPHINLPGEEKLMRYGVISRPIPLRLSFILGCFWSFLDVERPSSLLRELEELAFCMDRFPLDSGRERVVYESSLKELQRWDEIITSKIHEHVF